MKPSIGAYFALNSGALLIASAFLDWLAFGDAPKSIEIPIQDPVVAGRASTSRVRGIDDAHETTKSSARTGASAAATCFASAVDLPGAS
jgi:hypothetical protein